MDINEEVKTTEYAPAIFKAIRDMDKITDEMIIKSLDTESNRQQMFKAKESAGKSGSFFFFSYDR
jgi:1-phosphatidylinositol-4-phosphate 5-kinase